MSESRTISPWWGLLVLPIGLLGGWAVGKFTDPKPRAAATTAAGVESATRRAGRAARSEATTTGVSGASFTETAPPQSDARKEPKPEEYSAWTSFPSALAESERNGKPILLDFNAEWCPPCQRMKQTLFESASYSQAVQTAVIPVSIVDRRREDGSNPPEIEELQRRYNVEAFPTLVVFHPRTGKMVQARGFGGAEATAQWIAQAATYVR